MSPFFCRDIPASEESLFWDTQLIVCDITTEWKLSVIFQRWFLKTVCTRRGSCSCVVWLLSRVKRPSRTLSPSLVPLKKVSFRQVSSPFSQAKRAKTPDFRPNRCKSAKMAPFFSVVVPKDRETRQCKGFGFLTFVSPDDAIDALKGMDGKEVNGSTLSVVEATERRSIDRDRRKGSME